MAFAGTNLNGSGSQPQGMLSLSLNMVFQLIKYPLKHPLEAFILLTSFATGGMIKIIYDHHYENMKYALDDLHTAYLGPSFVYINDNEFEPARDLVGWTTDRHPTFYTDEDFISHRLTTSFSIDDRFSKKDQEGLHKKRAVFYHNCVMLGGHLGYCDLLSRRASDGQEQSVFGFYGKKNLASISILSDLDTGFVMGIRAFGNNQYDSKVAINNITYQLVKINLENINFAEWPEHNKESIAHVYGKDGELRSFPVVDLEFRNFYMENWKTTTPNHTLYYDYLKYLPTFNRTVDWVVLGSDVSKAMKGEMVENLLTKEKVNLLKWQTQQENIARQPLTEYGIFKVYQPMNYRKQNEPPLLFKIPKKSDVTTNHEADTQLSGQACLSKPLP